MRPIDADALKELLIDTLESIKKSPKMDGQEMHIIAACSMLGEMIDDAPTVSTVRHGRWIEYTKVVIPEPYNKWEQAWKCSECGFDGFIGDEVCLGCGAIMDGKEK